MKKIIILFFILPIVSCGTGTKVTYEGARVQVHEQNSNLITNCKKIGPVNFQHKPDLVVAYTSTPRNDTIKKAREITAELDGDTLVIVNMQSEFSGAVWNFQGIAMNCYGSNTNKIPFNIQNPEMSCRNNLDCANGYSCTNKSNGGTECRQVSK